MEPVTEKGLHIELNCMVIFIIAGLFSSILFHLIQAVVFNLNFYPHNTFLFVPADRFHDFTNIYEATVGLNPFKSAVSVYPPFAYLVMLPFTVFKLNMALALMLVGFTIFMLQYVYRTVSEIDSQHRYFNTIVLALATYPFLFVFDRANIEALVFILLALFIHFYQKKEDWKSVLCLAGAISIKMYPGAFLLIYLMDRKYQNILYTLLSVGAFTLISMFILKGGVAASYSGFIHNLAVFRLDYLIKDAGLQHNLSLFGTLRIFYSHFNPSNPFPELIYSVFMVSFFAAISFYLVFFEKEFWRAIAIIVLYILIAPQVSFDYKLVHLLIPITLFLNRKNKTKSALCVASAFALLCIPKDYYLIRGDISIAVIINPLVIITLMLGLIYQGYSQYKSLRSIT